MTLAENRYEVLVEKGIWNAPSAEEENIMALETTIRNVRTPNAKDQLTIKQARMRRRGQTTRKFPSQHG